MHGGVKGVRGPPWTRLWSPEIVTGVLDFQYALCVAKSETPYGLPNMPF